MKKLNTIAFALVLSFVALTNVSAQENSFDDETLIQLKKTSAELMKNQKMRIVTVKEQLRDEGEISLGFTKTITEILPPDRRRFISEEQTKNGVVRNEFVYIGTKSFVRRNNGAWEIYTVGNGYGGYGTGNGNGGEKPKVEKTTVKILTKGETINNQKVDLYKTVVTTKNIYPTYTSTYIYAESFWFDSAGRMIRSVNDLTICFYANDLAHDRRLRI